MAAVLLVLAVRLVPIVPATDLRLQVHRRQPHRDPRRAPTAVTNPGTDHRHGLPAVPLRTAPDCTRSRGEGRHRPTTRTEPLNVILCCRTFRGLKKPTYPVSTQEEWSKCCFPNVLDPLSTRHTSWSHSEAPWELRDQKLGGVLVLMVAPWPPAVPLGPDQDTRIHPPGASHTHPAPRVCRSARRP